MRRREGIKISKWCIYEKDKRFIHDEDIYLAECDSEKTAKIIVEAVKKQEPQAVNISKYNPESDNYYLHCSVCDTHVGSLENEDGDGIYKYNLVFNYCPECGQRLKVPRIVEG